MINMEYPTHNGKTIYEATGLDSDSLKLVKLDYLVRGAPLPVADGKYRDRQGHAWEKRGDNWYDYRGETRPKEWNWMLLANNFVRVV